MDADWITLDGCDMDTVVVELAFPSGYTVACDYPLNIIPDFIGPEDGLQPVTWYVFHHSTVLFSLIGLLSAIGQGEMPAGTYTWHVFVDGSENFFPGTFTITHSQITIVSGVTTTVPVTVTQASTVTSLATATITATVPGQTITSTIGGGQTTVTRPATTVTKTSTITEAYRTRTETITTTTCVPTQLGQHHRNHLSRRDVTVTTTTAITQTVTDTVTVSTEIQDLITKTLTTTTTGAPATTLVSKAVQTVTVPGSTVTRTVFRTEHINEATVTHTKTATITGVCR